MKQIIISRTDSIGDVILTIPLAGYLKEKFPGVEVSFIGQNYTLPVLKRSKFIDTTISKSDLKSWKGFEMADAIIFVFPDKEVAKWAMQKKIPVRIGTSHRFFHWLYANRRIGFSRKNSELHEAQLNFKLLKGLGIDFIPSIKEIPKWYGFPKSERKKSHAKTLILHPKSKGSAREWPLSNYEELVESLSSSGLEICITGTKEEGALIKEKRPSLLKNPAVQDKTGEFTLDELMDFISKSDGLIAASTGPLHLASAYGIYALGLYPPLRPMHPERWGPLGEHSGFLKARKDCQGCPIPAECACMEDIKVEEVKNWVNKNLLENNNP